MRLDPKLQHCTCGHHYKLSWLQYIRMLFQDTIVRCPRCNRVHKYRLTYFVNEVWDNDVKRDNKQIESIKNELWSKP